jgi:ATP-binding cassette subfamily B protein
MHLSLEAKAEHPMSTALAALAAVATRLGIDTNAEQLRRRFSLDAIEPDSGTLIGMARELGLEAKSLHVTFAELPRLSKTFPAILRAKDGGALLVEDARTDPMKGSVVIIRDPTAPETELVAVEEIQLAEFWEGELILVKRVFSAGDDQQPFGMAWLVGQILREAKLFRDIGYGAVVSTLFAIAPPFMFMITIDRVLVDNSYPTLNVLVGAILLMIVTETIVGHVRRILTQVATTRIDGRLNIYIVEKLLKLPLEYFESNPTGRTLNKVQNIWQIRNFLTGQLFGAFLETVPLLGLIPIMLILQWQLALIAFALAIVIFVTIMVFLPPLARAHRRVVVSDQAKTAHLVETLYGMRTIKSLCLEARRRKEWDRRVAEATAARHAMGLLANWPQTLTLPLQRLIYSGCFALGAYMVLSTSGGSLQNAVITPGTLVAFAILSMRLAAPLISIATLQMDIAELRSDLSGRHGNECRAGAHSNQRAEIAYQR